MMGITYLEQRTNTLIPPSTALERGVIKTKESDISRSYTIRLVPRPKQRHFFLRG
jgi:hypothetical protein